jgi:hypothetical protein
MVRKAKQGQTNNDKSLRPDDMIVPEIGDGFKGQGYPSLGYPNEVRGTALDSKKKGKRATKADPEPESFKWLISRRVRPLLK